jgi:hypothetical protein
MKREQPPYLGEAIMLTCVAIVLVSLVCFMIFFEGANPVNYEAFLIK